MADVKFLLTGDTSLSVEFGNEISEAINTQIRAFNIALQDSKLPGIVETVPTYRSLMIHYDPGVILPPAAWSHPVSYGHIYVFLSAVG